ncbi:FAD-binding oxidoreductase [Pseudonocardia sp. CA-107938]|uniref:FAD-binding oxidoreductase n=1 Tax=Pseudonocardia sp. CA-107938 TaxID=3240021 RepID=UPI003D94B7F8
MTRAPAAPTTPGPGIAGVVITPGHPDYDTSRTIWNRMIDRRPSHILRCVDAEDVCRGLGWARATGREVTVRGGGHSIPGHSVIDDGVVIDLSDINGVFVDPVARIARVGGGCLLGDLDRATQAHGLMTPAGAISHTGVGGLTLGGGLGWTMRRFGLTIDNLLAAEVVTAAGEVLRASATEHPDLFWALRGGGGNFGVVTEFEFALHELGPVHLAANAFEVHDAPVVLRAMRDRMPTAPDELVWSAFFRRLPDWPWAPRARVGEPVLLAPLAWVGDGDGRDHIDGILADLARLGVRPLATGHGPIPYVELQQLNDELNGHGHRNYHKSAFLRDLTDDTIDVLCARGGVIASANSQLEVLSMGGAISRTAPDATAFPHRTELWPVNVCGIWRPDEDDATNVAWVKDTFAALRPHLGPGSYHNFGGSDADEAETKDGFGRTWTRLREVKTRYDPDNVFRHCANIPPLGEGD